MNHDGINTLIVQISRGMAPAISIAESQRAAREYSANYQLVWGKPAAEAKTDAIEMAITNAEDLVLVEDDVLATPAIWQAAICGPESVAYCDAICRDGRTNTGRRADGQFIATGTVLVRLALPVLIRLRKETGALPLEAWEFHKDPATGGLVPTARDPLGRGSDIWLWYHITKLGYEPQCLGKVTTILHPFNDGTRHDLRAPNVFKYV